MAPFEPSSEESQQAEAYFSESFDLDTEMQAALLDALMTGSAVNRVDMIQQTVEAVTKALDRYPLPEGVHMEPIALTDEDKRVRRIRYTLTMSHALAECIFLQADL